MMTDPITVIDVDREAYLELNMLPEFDAIDVRDGRWDNVTGLRAFARHRLAERAAVVAYLRCMAEWHDKNDDGWSGYDKIAQGAREFADAILQGEHIGGNP